VQRPRHPLSEPFAQLLAARIDIQGHGASLNSD
jgi:hypothetical protein